jgi:mannose-6-phosphate isomerase-like protein (cupin superfamily)
LTGWSVAAGRRPRDDWAGPGGPKNARGAFAVPAGGRARVEGRRVLLVDDLLTTGATIEACTLALLSARARSAELFRYGTARILYYQPKDKDVQTPHDQDEVYIVAQGTGWFVNGGTRHPFKPQNVLFVAAGVEHRFEGFTEDFATWVVFYGPKGGEAAG